jgi:hypothetical protein
MHLSGQQTPPWGRGLPTWCWGLGSGAGMWSGWPGPSVSLIPLWSRFYKGPCCIGCGHSFTGSGKHNRLGVPGSLTGSLITPSPPGTRIIYDRKFLMECRNSPVAKTPPKDLPAIPGVTSPTSDEPPMQASQSQLPSSPEDKRAGGESCPGPELEGGLSVLRNSTFQGEGDGGCPPFEEQL